MPRHFCYKSFHSPDQCPENTLSDFNVIGHEIEKVFLIDAQQPRRLNGCRRHQTLLLIEESPGTDGLVAAGIETFLILPLQEDLPFNDKKHGIGWILLPKDHISRSAVLFLGDGCQKGEVLAGSIAEQIHVLQKKGFFHQGQQWFSPVSPVGK